MKKELHGILENIYLKSPGGSREMIAVDQVEVTFEGLRGDAHSSLTEMVKRSSNGYMIGATIRNTRQISLISLEELNEVAADLGLAAIDPILYSSNLLISGLPNLSLLPAGSRLIFAGGVGLVVEGANAPCMDTGRKISEYYSLNSASAASFVKAAYLKRGIVAWVEAPGVLLAGQEVRAVINAQPVHPLLA